MATADAVRLPRELRGLSQRQLGKLLHVAPSYIPQVEGGKFGMSAKQLRRLAEIVDLPLPAILEVAGSPERVSRATFLAVLAKYGAEVAGAIVLAGKSQATTVQAPEPVAPSNRGPVDVQTLVSEAATLNAQGRWSQARDTGLRAAALQPEGSREWALLTLYWGSQMSQQAGDIQDAYRHIAAVRDACIVGRDHPDPLLESLVANQAGWIADEQEGDLEKAKRLFEESFRSLNPEMMADDPVARTISSTNHHFPLRIHSEEAMTQAGSWIALPRQPLPNDIRLSLERSIKEHGIHGDPENPHYYHRNFIVESLLGQRDAFSNLLSADKKTSIFRKRHCSHLIHLSEAKIDLLEGDWNEAIAKAAAARSAYGHIRFPQGIALCSAIEGYAIARRRLANSEEYEAALDRLMLALILHDYETHPLWKEIAALLTKIDAVLRNEPTKNWRRNYIGKRSRSLSNRRVGE
jgi:transcriptional regulator with XRE-family HTH domain